MIKRKKTDNDDRMDKLAESQENYILDMSRAREPSHG